MIQAVFIMYIDHLFIYFDSTIFFHNTFQYKTLFWSFFQVKYKRKIDLTTPPTQQTVLRPGFLGYPVLVCVVDALHSLF